MATGRVTAGQRYIRWIFLHYYWDPHFSADDSRHPCRRLRALTTEQLREAVKRAERRLKGFRTNGDVLSGVRVAGEVHAVFEHIEPRDDRLPSWLDLTVPDDRFAASCLLLQAEHPGSALYAATGDINLQTKLTAVGLPFIELPASP